MLLKLSQVSGRILTQGNVTRRVMLSPTMSASTASAIETITKSGDLDKSESQVTKNAQREDKNEPISPGVSSTRPRDAVASDISAVISDQTNRLFAVVFIHKRQYKVSTGDIIHVEGNYPVDVGDQIKLEKVLLAGGEDFTLVGRPLLNADYVKVNATVIEKTTTSPNVLYREKIDNPNNVLWLSRELTVLRVNDITMDRRIFDETR